MEGSRQDSDQDREIGRIVTRKRGSRDQEEGMELSAGLGLESCLVKRSGEDVREPAAGEPSRGAHRVRDCAGMSCTGIEELASAVAELEESNHKLAVLRAQGDTTHGTPILFPTLGNKNTPGDNVRDKEKELQNLEACHKELTDLISQRLVEIKRLHEERIEILSKLATFQNTLRDCKSISSSKAFQVLKDQLQKSQTELDHCQTLLEKLQVDKDKFIRQEREVNVKVDLAGIPHRVSVNCESSIAVLEQNLQKMLDEKNMLVAKLEESSREPGRNQIISEFKALVSSLPREMGTMQSELSRYQDDASELHSLQAEVHSISDTLTRKLDFAVLKYRNQKLSEQLEVHKFEYHSFERKFDDLKQRQKSHHETKDMVNKSWEHLVRDLEAISVCKSGYQNSAHTTCDNNVSMDGAFIPKDKDFLSRLVETSAIHLENHAQSSTTDVLKNVLFSSNDSWHAQKSSLLSLFAALPENECSRQLQSTANELLLELNDAIEAFSDLYLKHKQLAEKYHNEKYSNARRKAEQKRLKEELASAVAELEESNHKLAVLRAQGDTTHGAPILFPTLGNRNTPGDNVRDKEKELQDLEACHKELTDLISQRLVEIKRLHEERIEILSKLATFQNTLTDCKSISSSEAFQVLKDQLQKLQAELDHCQTLLEKLQVDKDKFIWQEREINVKVDLAGIPHRMSVNWESSIAVLEQNLRKVLDEKNMLVAKLEESSREPGRNQIISEFKVLVSSLPREMGTMQSELSRYKDDASELHSLRAEVHSLSDTLTRKEHAINESLHRSACAGSEIRDLQSRVCELRQTNCDLKLFMEMYKRESTDSSDVLECKNREYYEWAHVQSLKSFLDENRLEQRVKEANEAEATSQQRLAGGEAKIAELRGVMESSRREIGSLSELLKSKHEEGEAYLSEIESIGQAYEDVQTQNQQLLQQIIERDDHNTKIFMEGVKVKQAQDVLHLEVCNLTRNLQQAKSLMDLYKEKVAQLDDKLKVWSEQVGRLSEDGWRYSVSSGNAQRKLVDVQGEAQQLRLSLDQVQAKVGRSRLEVAGLLIELEKDRFSKRRIEDDLELMSRKASSLRAKTEASSVLEKVHQEVKEYRGILKCGVCRDRQKEVVITKCYHLFCNECIQRLLRNRQRRCPSCGLSFGANDVKPIYI